ncbi:MAG: ABC transporter ATP-binding protein [Acholeplasmataceae bacterium]
MINLTEVSKIYQNGDIKTTALNDLDLSIEKGHFVVVLGPSGSGKSTLLNVLSGLDRPTAGSIQINDDIISQLDDKGLTTFRRHHLGFVFQQYNLLPTLTVYENVALGFEIGPKSKPIEDMLKDVGLLDHKDKYPYQLSGGEQQRVSIARALIKEPLILFCDEPTGALDEKTGKSILKLLQTLNTKTQTTILLITHNEAIGKLADVVIKMNSGRIIDIIKQKEKMSADALNWS